MSTLPKGSRDIRNKNKSFASLDDQVSELFSWDESVCTEEVREFLNTHHDRADSLTMEELNKIFQRHNGAGYGLGNKLGKGGFATVYSVNDDDFSGLCVKVIDVCEAAAAEIPNSPEPEENISGHFTFQELLHTETFKRRLDFAKREYEINLKIHDSNLRNCVPFYPELSFVDHSVRPYMVFLVMKKMDGNLLSRPDELSNEISNRALAMSVLDTMLRTLNGLNYLKIFSRDVSPQNIMYSCGKNADNDFDIYLGDFGIGRFDNNTITSNLYGTQFKDPYPLTDSWDIRSDMYSLALVAAYIDRGFIKTADGNPENILSEMNAKRKDPEKNDSFYTVLCKATEPMMEQRYADSYEMLAALNSNAAPAQADSMSELKLYKKIDQLNEKHSKEIEELIEEHRNEIDQLEQEHNNRLSESDEIISKLNAQNTEQKSVIIDLKAKLESAGRKITELWAEITKKEETITEISNECTELKVINHELQDENLRIAEMAEKAPDKMLISSQSLWIVTGVLFAAGFLFDIILESKTLSTIHYLITVIAACTYVWKLYSKRIAVSRSIAESDETGLAAMKSDPVPAKRLRSISIITIISILLTLPAVNIIRYFGRIRDISSNYQIAPLFLKLNLSFSTSSMCVFLSVCIILGLILFTTCFFSYSRIRTFTLKSTCQCILTLLVITVFSETLMYYLAGYNTLGFSVAADEPVIYWHDPENPISRKSTLAHAENAIRLDNNGVTHISYDATAKELVFTDSAIFKPLYFSGNINLKFAGHCRFDNQTDENAENIRVINGNLVISKEEDTKLDLVNTKGGNIYTDRYFWLLPSDTFEVNVDCDSDTGCIYAGYGAVANTSTVNGRNSGDGYYIAHGFRNSQFKPAETITVIKSENGQRETFPLTEIDQISQYINGARYDADKKTIILNDAEITAPVVLDGYISISINGKCSFTNPQNLAAALLTVQDGYVKLSYSENAELEMINHAGEDIVADEYVYSAVNTGKTTPNYVCNSSSACIYAGCTTNMHTKIANITNENESGELLAAAYH